MAENELDGENGAPERAVRDARDSIRRAREIVAASRLLLLGDAPAAGEALFVFSEKEAVTPPGSEIPLASDPRPEAG